MNPDSYILAGKNYSREELKSFCNSKISANKTEDWEKEIFHFILEWFNEKEFIVAHTSGSTGTPKRLELPKTKMAESAKMTAAYFGLNAKSKVLLALPASYIAGKMMIVRALVNQWDLYWVNPKGNVLSTLPNVKINFTALVPLQAENTLKEPSNWVHIEKCLLGGAPVSESLKTQVKNFPTLFFESYGMTETMSHVAIKKLNDVTNVFEALSDVYFETDDRDCLKIFAPKLIDAPLQTNDIVNLKDNKHFIWLGRYDNVINSGGVKLFPEQIEAKLKPHIPFEFFIAAKPDDKLGEKVVLVIEAKKDQASKIDFLNLFQKSLGKYERPKEVYLKGIFHRSKSGKTMRKQNLLKAFRFNFKPLNK